MKRVKSLACIALLLTACLLMSGCWPLQMMDAIISAVEDRLPASADARDSGFIHYDQMEYERPDLAAILEELEQLTQGIAQAGSFEELWELDERASELSSDFYTMYTLAELRSYHDMNDPYYKAERLYCGEASATLSNKVADLNRAIVASPYADQYRDKVGAYVYASMEDQLLLQSPEVEEYHKERSRLEVEYDDMIANATLEVDGRAMTLEEINELDWQQAVDLREQYFESNSLQFAELYARLVELDKITAETLGLESAADMYYKSFSRDYTPADALALCRGVKDAFGALTPYVFYMGYNYVPMSLSGTMDLTPAFLEKVNPQLTTAWADMLEYGLCDIEPLAGKQQGIAFTTTINGYSAPFIYMYWQDDFGSTRTLVHEFGHFYDTWLRDGEYVVFNLDISEIYSQGLELLLYQRAEAFTDQPEDVRQQLLYFLANGLIYQSVLEEFQLMVYEMDSFTRDDLSLLFAQLLEEYGISDGGGMDHTWFEVEHLFVAPFYTISYVTSATVALQIWEQSLTDWDAAAQTYNDLIEADQNTPFTQLVQNAGLGLPQEPGVLDRIADNYAAAYGLAGLPAAA